jgi:hypothetical protein
MLPPPCSRRPGLNLGLLTVLPNSSFQMSHSGIVVPEKAFRNTTLEELKDNAPAKTKSKAEDGAPAGFPEGRMVPAQPQPALSSSRQHYLNTHSVDGAWQLCSAVLRPPHRRQAHFWGQPPSLQSVSEYCCLACCCCCRLGRPEVHCERLPPGQNHKTHRAGHPHSHGVQV